MKTPDEPAHDHDVLKHEGASKHVVKVGNDAPYPHVACCAGCRRMLVCHGCGFPVSAAGHHGTLMRCTSGACPRCCSALHKHPQG